MNINSILLATLTGMFFFPLHLVLSDSVIFLMAGTLTLSKTAIKEKMTE